MKARRQTPQQERSRRTEDALLNACLRVLERDGLEACTVPQVAAEAGLAPATIYRRFPHKQAMLHAAFTRALRSLTPSREELKKTLLRPTLAETAERIVASLQHDFRAHGKRLHALQQLLAIDPKADFAQRANKQLAAHLKALADVLLKHRDRIRHEDPERAALFAVLLAASAIQAVVLEPASLWSTTLPLADKALTAEHTRAMVAYLRRKP